MTAIVRGYVNGMIGDITTLHAHYYHKHWGFGRDFEAVVAQHMAQFLERYNDERDGIWTIKSSDRIAAVILIDGIHLETDGAHLRYFLVAEKLQGKGIGRQLMQTALDFCDEKQFGRVYLKTLNGMAAAKRLYQAFGFVCLDEPHGDPLQELYYERLWAKAR